MSALIGSALNSIRAVVPFRYSTIISLRNASMISLDNLDTSLKKGQTSKVMKSYLERAVAHDAFMRQEALDFKIGKRHLANMMGEDPETFTQEDVDRSIEYLFPSGIYDKLARPMMKPPEQIHPSKKAAEFDESGRPHHFLFYTTKCNFFKILYDIADKLKELQNYEDQMIRKNLSPDPNKKLVLDITSSWIDKTSLENMTVEILISKEYDSFIASLDRLLAHPYSYICREFIEKFRIKNETQTKAHDIPQPLIAEDGRKYITVYECLRKNCRGDVTIRSPGTGKLTINGHDITYFEDIQPREQTPPYASIRNASETYEKYFGSTGSQYLHPNHHTTKLVGGHDDLKRKLFEFGITDDFWCVCGEGRKDADHVMLVMYYFNK